MIAVTNADDALVEGTDFRVDSEVGFLRLLVGDVGSRSNLASWSDVPDDVVVTYVYGYTPSTVPEELRRAADLIASKSLERDRHTGKDSVTQGTYKLSFTPSPIPADAARILAFHEDIHHT